MDAAVSSRSSKACRWCGSRLPDGALVCTKCESAQYPIFHPTPRLMGVLFTAALLPLTAMVYQRFDSSAETERLLLERTSTDLASIVGLTEAYQPLRDGFRTNCKVDHQDKLGACLTDYTDRMVAMDAFVARVSWTVTAAPVSPSTNDLVERWKNLWWSETRVALKKAYTQSSKLLECQSDFETSACVSGIDAAMKEFEDDTLLVFCGFALDLDGHKLRLMQSSMTTWSFGEARDVSDYREHITRSGCCRRLPANAACAKGSK